MNHATEELLVLYHYGDADASESAAIEEHLHACAPCRARLQALEQALDAVSTLEVPERGDGYGAEVWARLQPALPGAAPGRWWRFSFPSLAFAGSLAVLLIAAFVAGQYWPRESGLGSGDIAGLGSGDISGGSRGNVSRPQSASAEGTATPEAARVERIRDRVLFLAVGDHLERSHVALVEVMNTSDGQVDISSEQERARSLIAENRLYRETAADAGEVGVAAVLDELERVLVEIANSPSRLGPQDLERVRARIEEQGLIFKVRVLGDSVRRRELPRGVVTG